MIAVRIPKEIREYKEKVFLGLTGRQIIASFFVFLVCVPTYIWGQKYIGEEAASWVIMIVAVPGVAIGFIKKNGMPFEKYMWVILRERILFPQKTYFKSDNFFRKAQEEAEKEDRDGISQKQWKKYKQEASLERAYFMEQAEANGQELAKEELENLLTVRKPAPNRGGRKKKKENDKKQNSTGKKSPAQIISERVSQKRQEDPHYIPNPKEKAALLRYAKEQEKAIQKKMEEGKKEVAKKSNKMKQRRNARSFIPKSTQDDLPYVADFEEGLFEVEPNKYSKCYEIRDINYLTAKDEEAVSIFMKYGEFLNSFSEDETVGLCIDNRVVSSNEQEQRVFYKLTEDGYDVHRTEFNKVLKRQMLTGNNDIKKSKYITVTIDADSPYEALLRFHKIDSEVNNNVMKIGSKAIMLSTEERLSRLHDKMRKGREGEFKVDFDFLKEQGLSSKDYVAPSSFYFKKKDHFMIEDTFYRCMYLSNLPASLTDEFLYELTDCEFPVITNLNIQPVAQDKALRIVKKQLTGMEANKIEAEKKALNAGYSPETIGHDLKQSLAQAEELLDDMMNKNQKMFFVTIVVMVSGNTLDELNNNSKILISKARKYTCQLQRLDDQHRDAYKVALPMGVPAAGKIFVDRTLTTESTAIFIPFASVELFQSGGFYYGLNQITRNLILCDRTKAKTPSGFVLGSSGSGKSFACKREMLCVLLANETNNLLVIDPENEYGRGFAQAFGGTVLTFSAGSETYINPMDMSEDYGLDENDDPKITPIPKKKEKALKKKAEYLMSIIESMLSDGKNVTTITPQQKSLIDKAIRRTYKTFLNHDFNMEYIPTLLDLQAELDKEKQTEDGRQIAEAMEYYTTGSMNLFSHKTNVHYENRFVVFNIRDLGKELKEISLLIVLDFIWNRMISNFQDKIKTYCYVDEIHVLLKNYFSAEYLQQLYKRGRKYGLIITGITQDVEDLLRSEMAGTMLKNSDFILMLNQNGDNLKTLSKLLGISDAQANYISKADAGTGLLFAEKVIVPFMDDFPKDSYLYTLMSTNFGDESNEDMEKFIAQLIKDQEKREQEKREKETATEKAS